MREILRRVRDRLRPRHPRPAILMYHRVASVHRDPWGLAVAPQIFAEQLAYLRCHRTPFSMEQFVDRLRSGNLPQNAVAVTFDDGYRDNLVNASPLLKRYEIPATLFLPTGLLGCAHPFWWDELAAMILDSTVAVNAEQLVAGDKVVLSWGTREAADLRTAWWAWEPPQSRRQEAYINLWLRLQRVPTQECELIMRSLRDILASSTDSLASAMSIEEVQSILAGGLVSIGAHTATHPALTALSPQKRRDEIRTSLETCRSLSPTPVVGFAYPYGDINTEVRNDVAASGPLWACSTKGGFADQPELDLLTLPRLAVPNGTLADFVKLITDP